MRDQELVQRSIRRHRCRQSKLLPGYRVERIARRGDRTKPADSGQYRKIWSVREAAPLRARRKEINRRLGPESVPPIHSNK